MPAVAGVAQLVEQWFCKPQVGGSTPSAGTTRRASGGFLWSFTGPRPAPAHLYSGSDNAVRVRVSGTHFEACENLPSAARVETIVDSDDIRP